MFLLCFEYFYFLTLSKKKKKKKKDLYSSLMDPLNLENAMMNFSKAIGTVIQGDENWEDVLSSSSGPSFECFSLFEKLCEIFKQFPQRLDELGNE